MLGSGCMSPAPRSPGCSFSVEATIVPPPSYSPGTSKLLVANVEQPLILELPAGAIVDIHHGPAGGFYYLQLKWDCHGVLFGCL